MGCAEVYVLFSVCSLETKPYSTFRLLNGKIKDFFWQTQATLSPLFHLPSHLPLLLPLISLYWAEFNPAALRK